jgi:hypothetical protein
MMDLAERHREQTGKQLEEAFQLKQRIESALLVANNPVEAHRMNNELERVNQQITRLEAEFTQFTVNCYVGPTVPLDVSAVNRQRAVHYEQGSQEESVPVATIPLMWQPIDRVSNALEERPVIEIVSLPPLRKVAIQYLIAGSSVLVAVVLVTVVLLSQVGNDKSNASHFPTGINGLPVTVPVTTLPTVTSLATATPKAVKTTAKVVITAATTVAPTATAVPATAAATATAVPATTAAPTTAPATAIPATATPTMIVPWTATVMPSPIPPTMTTTPLRSAIPTVTP